MTKAPQLVQWTDDLSVGIAEIDHQHQVLVALLNELHEVVLTKGNQQEAVIALDRLIEYTRIHFATEEKIMKLVDYQDYDNHKQHHDLLIEQVVVLGLKVRDGKRSFSFELLQFLKLWLTRHILEEDMRYVPHFQSQGVHQSQNRSDALNRLLAKTAQK